jgi:hypothetical protein
MGAITKRHRLSLATAIAFTGIIAGASVAFATMLPGSSADERVTASPTTVAESTTSTIPTEPGPPLVVLPADGTNPDGTENPDGVLAPTGVEVTLFAVDDPESLTGGGWDEWGFGIDGWDTTTTTTEPKEVGITAYQAYGPASSNTYEKIYGTAPPGTRVLLTSAYGSSDATVGESGEYYVKVYFSGQPSNQYFPITAQVGPNTYTFQFKWTGSFEVSASQYYGPVHDQRYDKVYGTAPPGTIVTTSSDYGSSDMVVGEGGDYYLKIHFSESLPSNQKINWTATLKDPSGNVLLTKTFSFTYEPNYTVTASQYYGPVNGEPNEKFVGTAPPGSLVSVSSPFGSKSMTVDGSGAFILTITFVDPTPNEAFTIDVTVAEESFSFSFTYEVT